MSKENLELFWKLILNNDLKKNGADIYDDVNEYDIRPVSEKSCVVFSDGLSMVFFQENGLIINTIDGGNVS